MKQHPICKPPEKQAIRVLSAAQMRIGESKSNRERRKKAQQIGYVVGYGLGN